ncbi:uncharacterized protein METZ01_LOCUS382558 [marine metagenome]|uniref:Uncharacterized protein n=1 Tax=marine metagenome TaxID=408172 RepID=A0A382U5X4_9ZZZZ
MAAPVKISVFVFGRQYKLYTEQ